MEGSTPPGRRTLTPAVLASALFVAASAVFAITFVATRGGLQMPVAPSGPAAAVATGTPTGSPAPSSPTATSAPTTPPTLLPTAPPSAAPPTQLPTPAPTLAIPTLRPDDPLAILPGCPDHPGCYVYLVERGDTLSTIADRFRVPMDIILVLNPQITDPSVVVTNTKMSLGLSPFVTLDPCPGGELCWLYVVRSGDSLSEIAGRYGLTREQILAINPGMPRPIKVDQVIRLPQLA